MFPINFLSKYRKAFEEVERLKPHGEVVLAKYQHSAKEGHFAIACQSRKIINHLGFDDNTDLIGLYIMSLTIYGLVSKRHTRDFRRFGIRSCHMRFARCGVRPEPRFYIQSTTLFTLPYPLAYAII